MRFKSKGVWKKITALVATGILMSSSKSTINVQAVEPIKNVREADFAGGDIFSFPTGNNDNLLEKIKNPKNKVNENLTLKMYKGLIKAQLETHNVVIGSGFNEYISGIIIDGRCVSVEFKDGEKIQGDAERLELNELVLDKLYIYDSEYLHDYINMDYFDLKEKFNNRELLYVTINNTSVTKEFKASYNYFSDVFFGCNFDEEHLNLSKCKNIWLDNFEWSDIDKYINRWNSAQNIILTDLHVDDEYADNIIIENDSLKNIIIEPLSSISNIDLSGCDNLEYLIGIGQIKQIKGNVKNNILNFSTRSLDDDICAFSTEEKIEQYIIKDIMQAKDLIEKQFKMQEINIDGRYNHFISGIKIDGNNVEVEFSDGEKINGECSKVKILDIELKYLTVYDGEYLNNDYIDLNYLDLEMAQIKVLQELKICPIGTIYDKSVDFESSIDISKCKNIWLDSVIIDDFDIGAFNNDTELEKLILTNIYEVITSKDLLIIENDNLQTFIINFYGGSTKFDDFDLNRCKNLTTFSAGTHFGTTNLNGIKECKNLKKIGFGVPGSHINKSDIANLNFYEEEIKIIDGYDTSDKALGTVDNSFISDMTAIMNNSSIEVLDISLVEFVTSDHFLEVVKSLPNLKRIVGNEINQVPMFSEELIEYCNELGIEHPFTEKTLELKNYIRNIVNSIITPEMSELDKIRAISKYVMENMEYDYEVCNKILTQEDIIKTWGENIWYNFFYAKGVCEGYTEVAQNLMLEAGIEVFNCNIPAHTYNLVKVGETYYEIDLTKLDLYIELLGYTYDDYSYDINSRFYMEPVGGKIKPNVEYYMEPSDSKKQRRKRSSEIFNVDDFIHEAPNGNIKFSSQNIKNTTHIPKKIENIMKLLGILVALGIAKKISREEAINFNNDITWNIEDLKKLKEKEKDLR